VDGELGGVKRGAMQSGGRKRSFVGTGRAEGTMALMAPTMASFSPRHGSSDFVAASLLTAAVARLSPAANCARRSRAASRDARGQTVHSLHTQKAGVEAAVLSEDEKCLPC
jgi:hypothetical protein